MFQRTPGRIALRAVALSSYCFAAIGATLAAPVRVLSPVPEPVAPRDAWRIAEAHAARNPTCEVMVGFGGSMLPLYPDRTVLLVERVPMADLQAGMTVVFIGDSGRPVAHVLVEKTSRGWFAQGLANAERDHTLVHVRNYLGAVVRAFQPVLGLPGEGTASVQAGTASGPAF